MVTVGNPLVHAHEKSAAQREELLRAEAIQRSFGATQALASTTISLIEGEVHVLLGENGAGKSTLAKVFSGLHPDRRDRIFVKGQPAQIGNVRAARQLGIATVFQELSSIPELSVAENFALVGDPFASRYRLLRRRVEVDAARELLDSLGFDISPEAQVAELSPLQRQLVEIAKAFGQRPRILIMDEPTSLLTAREEPLIVEALRRFTAEGGAVLYVTHRIHETLVVGSRVSLMRQGRIVETRPIDGSVTEGDLIDLLTRGSAQVKAPAPWRGRGEKIVDMQEVHAGRDCHGVSLGIHRGEIVGLYGISGCGRETLAKTLVGLATVRGGTLQLDGQAWRPRGPSHAARLGIVYLPGSRKERGILAQRPIRENLTLGQLQWHTRFGLISTSKERRFAHAGLRQLAVKFHSMEDPISRLSGGNQQKILFGRAMRDGVRLAILEDPTAGVDLPARSQIHQQIVALAAKGVGVLLLSSDLRETLLLCDRIHVMRAGKIAASFEAPFDGGEPAILDAMMGQHR